MYRYEVYEDNAGGLTLIVLDNGNPIYAHAGYEYNFGQLARDIASLRDNPDANPADDWDGGEDDPAAIYDYLTSDPINIQLVADSDGKYPGAMGRRRSAN